MTAEDEQYVANLRDAFDRYLSVAIRPLQTQNHYLKTSLLAERKRVQELEAELAKMTAAEKAAVELASAAVQREHDAIKTIGIMEAEMRQDDHA